MNEVIATQKDTMNLLSKYATIEGSENVLTGLVKSFKPNITKQVWIGPFHVTINVH